MRRERERGSYSGEDYRVLKMLNITTPCLQLPPRAIVPRHGTHSPPYQPAFIAITWSCLQRTMLGESHPSIPRTRL
ncbi:hypothetical protein VNO80_11589 [Phaseolus coccineus]|uniref:Uncharacterized protein n=1 Tax=Phaseolus coccineus TaxID=3886 RepID=A0AAN9NFL8_PHACN